jgi:hypothetical protein
MFVASFAASVWAVKLTPTAAFYLAPYRFWEFLMGAGLVMARLPAMPARWALPTAAAGLAMIVYTGMTLPRGGAFPGVAAIMPCLGAVLLIQAGTAPGNAVSRLLSLKPVVFIGLISYSLYLWHWPIFVFAHAWLNRAPTMWEAAACAALTFACSVLSWRYVEQPFRNKQAVTRKPLFAAAGAVMAAICLFSLSAVETNGLPQRFGPQIAKIVSQEVPRSRAQARCFGVPSKDVSVQRLCGIGANAKPASFLLWGDSHAEALIPAVADIAKRHGRRGLFAGSPSCAPLLGVDRYDASDCRPFNDRVLAMILRHKEITTVILMARWGKNAQGTAYGDEGNGFVPIGDDQARSAKPSENAAIFARGLNRTIAALRADGRQVLLVGPVPEIGWTVPQVLARLEMEHKSNAVVAPLAGKFYEREKDVLPLFAHMAELKGVTAVFPHDYLCRTGRCAVRKNGIPLYKDEHHLSDYGAKKLEPLLSRAMEPLFAKVS